MTTPDDDLEEVLRRSLAPVAEHAEPDPGGLARIRARIGGRPPRPWVVAVIADAISRARNWTWRGHWALPDWQSRLASLSWPRLRWLPPPGTPTDGTRRTVPAILAAGSAVSWLRLGAVVTGLAIITSVSFAVQPFRQAIIQASTTVLAGGQQSGGAETDGAGSPTQIGGQPSQPGQATAGRLARSLGADSDTVSPSPSAGGDCAAAAPGPPSPSPGLSAPPHNSATPTPACTPATASAAPATATPGPSPTPSASSPSPSPALTTPSPSSAPPSPSPSQLSSSPASSGTSSPTPAASGSGALSATHLLIPSASAPSSWPPSYAERHRGRGHWPRYMAVHAANLAGMEPLIAMTGPPVFLVPPGGLAAPSVTLSGPEGHHAAAVRRLRTGERADVSDGAGTIAECVVTGVGRDSVTLGIRTVHTVPAPRPRLVVAQALPKGDRGELAVEMLTEVGADAVIPWAAERSITRWQGERGQRSHAKWRATAREAAKQSRRAWLPAIAELATTAGLATAAAAATCPVVLTADAQASLRELPIPEAGDVLLVIGPEGGISPAERATLRAAGAVEARLGPTVLRTSTAGTVAAAVLLSRTARW